VIPPFTISNTTSTLRYLSIALLLMLTLSAPPSFAQKEMSAFSYVDKTSKLNINEQSVTGAQADSAKVMQQEGVETWNIAFNDQALSLDIGDTLQIPLPSGKVLNATVTARNEFENGDVQLMASSGNHGRIILTVGDNTVFGSVVDFSDDVNYSISLDGDSSSILINQDSLPESSIDFTDDMVEPDHNSDLPQALETTAHSHSPVAESDEANEKVNIDMLFLYSSEFDELFGSAETRINQLIAFTNQAYDDTGILINLRVAGAVELEGIENNATVGTLLTGARTSDSDIGFGDVAALRNQTGGDLVAVLTTSTSNFASNGTAFVIGNSPSFAFSSTKLGLFCCDIVFAHEVGHNLGSSHQRAELLLPENSGISPCTGGVTGFSCGHSVNENGSTNWSTIMASGRNINRINIFSNLTLDCEGDLCGVAQGQPDAADNLTSACLSTDVKFDLHCLIQTQ